MEGVPRETEFVWPIRNFWRRKSENKNSREFKFGIYDCYLSVGMLDKHGSDECFNVYLIECNKKLVKLNKFCKLCLIDGRGVEFFAVKRNSLKFKKFCEFMNIMVSDLDCDEFNLVPNGILTLRLSWCDKESSTGERDTQAASYLNPEKEQRKLLQTLSEDFGRIYERKEATDFLLTVGSEKMRVHRAILSARSNAFANMFRQAISKGQGFVDIPNVDGKVFSDVLYYVYAGKTRGMSADTIVPMFEVADKYELNELMDECLNVLMSNLTVENVCDAARLAYTRGVTELEERSVQFVKEKREEIEKTLKWHELLKSEPFLADKLITST